jgi:type 1 glutamine amidotransferase
VIATWRAALFAGFIVSVSCNDPEPEFAQAAQCTRSLRVLWYTKQTEWMHTSNPIAQARFENVAKTRGWTFTGTADSSTFENLPWYDVVVFALSSGQTLDTKQRAAFQRYVRSGGGVAGFHSATHTDYDWPFMVDLFGAQFATHPAITTGTVRRQEADRLTTALPDPWVRIDEYYVHDRDPRGAPGTKVLLSLEVARGVPSPQLPEGSYPMAWTRVVPGGARLFYTALGHTDESYSDSSFVDFVARGIEWAGALRCGHQSSTAR